MASNYTAGRYKALDSASLMQLAFSLYVGFMGLIWRLKQSKVVMLFPDLNRGHPFVRWFDKSNPKKPRFAIGWWIPLVFRINSALNVSQITKTIVRWVSVDMVNDGGRPFPINVKPSESMRSVKPHINPYFNMQFPLIKRPGVKFIPARVMLENPRKNSCFWVIVEKIAQAFCGKIGISHDAPLMLIGQRPLSVQSTGAALLF